MLGAMDGVWVSPDAGQTWERRAEGLENLVLAEDPAVAGLPENIDPEVFGISAVSPVPGERGGLVVGTGDGLYLSSADGEPFVKLAGTAGRVDQIQIHGETGVVLYRADDHVFHTTLPES